MERISARMRHARALARVQLQAIAALPPADVLDPQYKEDAAALFKDIEKEKDEG